jgi:hypothetical protein
MTGTNTARRREILGDDAPRESVQHRVQRRRRAECLAQSLSRARVVFKRPPPEIPLLLDNPRGCVRGIRGTRRARLALCLRVLRGAAEHGNHLVDVARVEGRARLDEPRRRRGAALRRAHRTGWQKHTDNDEKRESANFDFLEEKENDGTLRIYSASRAVASHSGARDRAHTFFGWHSRARRGRTAGEHGGGDALPR